MDPQDSPGPLGLGLGIKHLHYLLPMVQPCHPGSRLFLRGLGMVFIHPVVAADLEQRNPVQACLPKPKPVDQNLFCHGHPLHLDFLHDLSVWDRCNLATVCS